jgi:hypothetical protein
MDAMTDLRARKAVDDRPAAFDESYFVQTSYWSLDPLMLNLLVSL